MTPDRHYEHKQHTFDSFCKKVLKCRPTTVIGRSAAAVARSRFQRARRIRWSSLRPYDRYPWEYTFFPCRGDVILIEDDRLAEALNALPQDGRDILLMYFFLDMADREIAERMNMARRTVNTRRHKAYRLLKELMGGDVDG